MLQSTLPETAGEQQTPSVSTVSNEFHYRPVPVTAPIALLLGVVSILALVSVFGIGVSLVGVVVAWTCLRTINRSEGEYGGGMLATGGLALSLLFLCSGSVLQAYHYQTEVPDGFQRVNFSTDIAKKGFLIDREGRAILHPEVEALAEQPVFLKGYMYPTKETEGLAGFILVKDNQQCCFGGNPELKDMIFVKMKEGLTADFSPRLVSVAGTFHVADPSQGGELNPVYMLEASHFSVARSVF